MSTTIDNHCKDCCCARSWEALGITEYTGKSIPEHVAELTAQLEEMKRENTRLSRAVEVIDDMGVYPAAILNGPNQYEKRTDKMDGWNDAVMEMHKRVAGVEPGLETSSDRLIKYIEDHLGHLARHAHSIYEVIDAAADLHPERKVQQTVDTQPVV